FEGFGRRAFDVGCDGHGHPRPLVAVQGRGGVHNPLIPKCRFAATAGSAARALSAVAAKQRQFPNGSGPRCSAIGPSAAAGRNNSAPTRTIVPRSTNPNVTVSVRMVPVVNGVGFLAARLAARASGAMIGTNRESNITSPVATSQ